MDKLWICQCFCVGLAASGCVCQRFTECLLTILQIKKSKYDKDLEPEWKPCLENSNQRLDGTALKAGESVLSVLTSAKKALRRALLLRSLKCSIKKIARAEHFCFMASFSVKIL